MALEKEHVYTEEEYENFEHSGLLEYDNGTIIAMTPPSTQHQSVVGELLVIIKNYLKNKSCKAFVSPFNVRLQLKDGIKRVEPDISVICDINKINDKGCNGAPDLIIEIASPGNLMHDYATKLSWYEQAGVREYWIVNPMKKNIHVYCFDVPDIKHFTFEDIVEVGIWNGELRIDFNEVEIL